MKPVLSLSNKYSTKPEQQRVFKALSDLFSCILQQQDKKGPIIPFESTSGKFIIFSDQHKGRRNGADDFVLCEQNYLTALDYYNDNNFHLIALGDCEELWENSILSIKKHQQPSFDREKKFVQRNAFIKIFGNHDLFWQNDPFAPVLLNNIYGSDLQIHEGVVLQTNIKNSVLNIFCTHGHQGDKFSDGNWLIKFFVSRCWAPLQAYLQINSNTPAYDAQLKTLHNHLMYEWSVHQQNVILITGHTHQPVFESLTHLERLYKQLLFARKQKDEPAIDVLQKEIQIRKFEYAEISETYLTMKPSYFNCGCCSYNDGDITGIEIAEGTLRLIKWQAKNAVPTRLVLEETPLEELVEELKR
jgi:predicted phosphodiesterase